MTLDDLRALRPNVSDDILLAALKAYDDEADGAHKVNASRHSGF